MISIHVNLFALTNHIITMNMNIYRILCLLRSTLNNNGIFQFLYFSFREFHYLTIPSNHHLERRGIQSSGTVERFWSRHIGGHHQADAGQEDGAEELLTGGEDEEARSEIQPRLGPALPGGEMFPVEPPGESRQCRGDQTGQISSQHSTEFIVLSTSVFYLFPRLISSWSRTPGISRSLQPDQARPGDWE